MPVLKMHLSDPHARLRQTLTLTAACVAIVRGACTKPRLMKPPTFKKYY